MGRFLLRGAGVLVALCMVSACTDQLLGEDPANTPEGNFQLFWEDMDRRYALFDQLSVNWDSLYQAYRPLVSNGMLGRELFGVMCGLIRELRDGHVTLNDGRQTCSGDDARQKPSTDLDLGVIDASTLGGLTYVAGGRIAYGRLLQANIGYIHVATFSGGESPVADWVREIDPIILELQDTDGLILDVRDNLGGNGFNAADMAGRFVDERRAFLISQTRKGPSHSDFTEPTTWFVEPHGGASYAGSIALLTNVFTFSAAEWFVLALRDVPSVTHIGTTTGGGLSSRIFRGLPNGWVYSISIQQARAPNGVSYEGQGIVPDILVDVNNSQPVPFDRALLVAVNTLRGNQP